MFFPLFDDNPTQRSPYVSWAIIATCVLVFLWQTSLDGRAEQIAFFQFGFVPANISGAAPLPPSLVALPAWATIFSSMFLHGGLMHIGGNMLYLWIFGDNVEDSMGRLKFAIFYLTCGAAAALTQFAVDPASRIPMVGASGGIAGVLGAYLILHPKAVIRTFLLFLVFIRFINLPAWVVLGIWIGGQFLAVPAALDSNGGGVAYFAHIGGFVAGMVLVPFFKRVDVPLFGRADPPHDSWGLQSFSGLRAEARNRYTRQRHNPMRSRISAEEKRAPVRRVAIHDERAAREHQRQRLTSSASSPWSQQRAQRQPQDPAKKRGRGSVPRFRRPDDE